MNEYEEHESLEPLFRAFIAGGITVACNAVLNPEMPAAAKPHILGDLFGVMQQQAQEFGINDDELECYMSDCLNMFMNRVPWQKRAEVERRLKSIGITWNE